MIEAVKSGFVQDEVEKHYRLKKEELSGRKRILIGTNQFPELHELMLGRTEFFNGPATDHATLYKRLVPIRISVLLKPSG